METATKGVEDFLGVCLGGKRCKARRKSRQENRKQRRSIRTEKLRAKKDALVLDNQASASSNELLNQIVSPQQQQGLSKQSVAQKAVPPVPQNNPPKKEDNTFLWVGGGIGTLIILGLIAFLVLKK